MLFFLRAAFGSFGPVQDVFLKKLLFDGVTMVGFQKFVVADCQTTTWTQVFKGALFEPHTVDHAHVHVFGINCRLVTTPDLP